MPSERSERFRGVLRQWAVVGASFVAVAAPSEGAASSVSAQARGNADGLPSSPSTVRAGQEKAVLEFAPAVGARLAYSVNGQMNVDGKSPFGKDIAVNAGFRGEIGLLIRDSSDDTVLAGLVTPGIDIQARGADQNVSQTLRTQAGESLDVVFSRTGKVTNILNPGVLTQEAPTNFSIPRLLRDYFPTLPVQPVAPEDQWRQTRRITIPFQGLDLQVDLTIDYVLNGILPSPDGRKAVITATYAAQVSGAKNLGASDGVFEGQGTGTGFLTVLLDRGYFTEYHIDFQTNAMFVMKQGVKRLLEWPFTSSVVVDVNLSPAARSATASRD
jgi:hypothetical protein